MSFCPERDKYQGMNLANRQHIFVGSRNRVVGPEKVGIGVLFQKDGTAPEYRFFVKI